jgi:hypothetical protein
MREIEVEGVEGLRHSEQSAGKDPNLENLQTELAAMQARVTELEHRLRLINQGRTSRVRALFSRLRPGASRERAQAAAEELQALGPDEVYYGSRGVRAADQEPLGPLHAVLLLGGLTEPELDSALRALARDGAADGEPLVVTDCDALRMLDRAGYLYEYIPPREDWEQRLGRDGDDYDDFLHRRLASIAGLYGLAGVPPIG